MCIESLPRLRTQRNGLTYVKIQTCTKVFYNKHNIDPSPKLLEKIN